MKLSFVFFVVSCLLTGLTASAQNNEGKLRIAFNLPLTGALGIYGTSVQEGIQMGLSEESDARTDLDWQDNQSSGRGAVTAFRQQESFKPDIYVSGVRPQTMTIWDEVAKAGLPHFVWIFDVSIKKEGHKNFRTYVNFKVEPPLFLEYAKERKAKRVAIVYVTLPHTDEEYQSIIIPGLKANGVESILVKPYDITLTDFKAIVSSFGKNVILSIILI